MSLTCFGFKKEVTLNTEEEDRIQGLRYMKRKQEREFFSGYFMTVLAKAKNIGNTLTVVHYMAAMRGGLRRSRSGNCAPLNISAVIAHVSVNLIVTVHNHLSTANRAFHNRFLLTTT